MANDNGLYLPLRIDLSDWERDLMEADADLQKTMNQMRSQVGNFKIKYDVEIANAKAAGNDARALELENKKLNEVYKAQKKAVEALNQAYQKSIIEKGADAKATIALARALVRESKAMENTRRQLDTMGLNIGKALSDTLSTVSPAFASVRQTTASITANMGNMGSAGVIAAQAIGSVGIAVAGLAAGVATVEKITDNVSKLGTEAAKANDPIYQLREQLETSYENAEELQGVLNIDGVGVEQYAVAMNKLNKQLLKAGENGNVASDMLTRWHVEMRNGDGSRKDAIEQLRELAAGYKRAQKAGEGQDYLTATGTTSLVHVLNDLDGYIAKWKAIRVEYERNYQLSHDLVESEARLKTAREQTAAIKGDTFLQASYDILQRKIDAEVIEAEIVKANKKEYEEYGKVIADVTNNWTDLKLQASVALDKALMDVAGLIGKLDETKKSLEGIGNTLIDIVLPQKDAVLKIGDIIPDTIKDKLKGAFNYHPEVALVNWIRDIWKKGGEEVDTYRKKVDEAKKETTTDKKIDETGKENPVDVEGERKKQKAEQDRIKAQEKFYKELRDIQSTEYEREINAIEEKRQAYIDAGVSMVEADRMYAIQKEAIDQKYYDKARAEQEKQAKEVEASYQKQIEAAKRARESQISEAESTLRSNLKLVRYIQQQKQQGTYTEAGAKQYAEQLYMRQNGIRNSDILALKDIGVGTLKDIANVRDRIFGQFATVQAPENTANNVTNNNTVNVNFDNTILDNVAAMDLLANKVAAIIQPAIERAVSGTTTGGGSYGY